MIVACVNGVDGVQWLLPHTWVAFRLVTLCIQSPCRFWGSNTCQVDFHLCMKIFTLYLTQQQQQPWISQAPYSTTASFAGAS